MYMYIQDYAYMYMYISYVHDGVFQVWQGVLWQLQKLLSAEEAGEALDSNIECFHNSHAIIKILLTSKVPGTVMYYVHVSAHCKCWV